MEEWDEIYVKNVIWPEFKKWLIDDECGVCHTQDDREIRAKTHRDKIQNIEYKITYNKHSSKVAQNFRLFKMFKYEQLKNQPIQSQNQPLPPLKPPNKLSPIERWKHVVVEVIDKKNKENEIYNRKKFTQWIPNLNKSVLMTHDLIEILHLNRSIKTKRK